MKTHPVAARAPAAAPSAHLHLDPPRIHAGQLRLGARLELPDAHHDLWFDTAEDHAALVTHRADPFVLAVLHTCMRRGRPLHVHGPVSAGLLVNLLEYQEAFAAHHRDYRAVPIVAQTELAPFPRPTREGLVAVSGGVDGLYSAYRHSRLSPHQPKRTLGAALMVHGFDVPLADAAAYTVARANTRAIIADLGLPLLSLQTNLRTLPVPWPDAFGAAIAAALTCFQERYAFGLIGSAFSYGRTQIDHGSNPLNDPLLSSDGFTVVHDGASAGRIAKLRALSTWPAAHTRLRVCWEGGGAANCGRCEKCIRTQLMLDLLDVPASPAFPSPVTPSKLSRLLIKSQGGIDEMRYLVAEARRAGRQKWWIQPAARCARRSQWFLHARALWRTLRNRRPRPSPPRLRSGELVPEIPASRPL